MTRRADREAQQSAYRGGRPRIAARVLGRDMLGLVPGLFFFVVLPVVGIWAAVQPGGPAAIRAPVALVLAGVVAWVLWHLVDDARRRFGLRVVPRFERRLDGHEGRAYFAGRALVGWLERLDRDAVELGLPTFAAHGGGAFDADAQGPWFDAGDGLRTVRGVLARSRNQLDGDVVADLRALEEVLTIAAAKAIRFRLVVVAGTAMSGARWEQLRGRGF